VKVPNKVSASGSILKSGKPQRKHISYCSKAFGEDAMDLTQVFDWFR
jgi:hypothetical protein